MKTDKYLYVVRHGEAEGNIDPTKRGPQTPLTEEGERQANIVAERFKNLPAEAIISSPMKRAQQTAEIIARTVNKKVVLTELAQEHALIKEIEDLPGNSPEFHHVFKKIFFELKGEKQHPDEESFGELSNRADKLLSFIEERDEKHVVLVSHARFLRFLLGKVLFGASFTPEQFYYLVEHTATVKNGGITVFRYWAKDRFWDEPKWRLVTWNDHAHFG